MDDTNNPHLQFFLSAPHAPQIEFGRSPLAWANRIEDGAGQRFSLPAGLLRRGDLHELRRSGASAEAFFLAVMAWGGMTVRNGDAAWRQRSIWVPIVTDLLRGKLDRRAAYERFGAQSIPGMRPAYFTKLIHFGMDPEAGQIGYIMDQWTAKSVNLIEGRELIRLDWSGYVSRANDFRVYEAYCQKVELLAQMLGVAPTDAEERLFSEGGRKPAPWRAYVKTNYGEPFRPQANPRAA